MSERVISMGESVCVRPGNATGAVSAAGFFTELDFFVLSEEADGMW
jgi:hypothetical protein